ncbi:MAG: hypothetical protein Q8O16_03225 [Dehalococcoidia bacterium]|nr:hypothetical protein [Dehalococcoidia bacterium]
MDDRLDAQAYKYLMEKARTNPQVRANIIKMRTGIEVPVYNAVEEKIDEVKEAAWDLIKKDHDYLEAIKRAELTKLAKDTGIEIALNDCGKRDGGFDREEVFERAMREFDMVDKLKARLGSGGGGASAVVGKILDMVGPALAIVAKVMGVQVPPAAPPASLPLASAPPLGEVPPAPPSAATQSPTPIAPTVGKGALPPIDVAKWTAVLGLPPEQAVDRIRLDMALGDVTSAFFWSRLSTPGVQPETVLAEVRKYTAHREYGPLANSLCSDLGRSWLTDVIALVKERSAARQTTG